MSTPKLPSEKRVHRSNVDDGHPSVKTIIQYTRLAYSSEFADGDRDLWYFICIGIPTTWGSNTAYFWAVDPIKTGGKNESE